MQMSTLVTGLNHTYLHIGVLAIPINQFIFIKI